MIYIQEEQIVEEGGGDCKYGGRKVHRKVVAASSIGIPGLPTASS